METWSKEELQKIAKADDLHIAPFREDGVTYGPPTWIWSVAVGDVLHVRGYNRTKSRWYQVALRQKAGRIIAVGTRNSVLDDSFKVQLERRRCISVPASTMCGILAQPCGRSR